MDATAAALLSLACPAFTAVCLYRSNHRKHRTTTTAAAWLLALPAVIGPMLAAQHTHGWGVVGWIVNLITAVTCLIHLLPTRLWAKRKKPSPRWLTAVADSVRRPTLTQGSLAIKHTGLHRKMRYPKQQAKVKTKAKWQDNLGRGRSAPGAPGSRASHPILQWSRDFLGIHRPWTPKQRPQALTEHREEIISAMADEARTLGRVDVLDDAMAELHQAYRK